MALTYGFFNSVDGDRTYNAEQISTMFEGLITDGVYESVGNKLAVQPNNGMTVQVATGRGFFAGHWVKNSTAYPITLEGSDVTLNRYAAIVVKVDENASARNVSLTVKYSAFASSPTKPTMTRTESINEYCLAYVYIKAGATAITAANIEDTRGNTNLCGWVTGLIDQLDSTTLFTQFTTVFNEWFSDLQDDLNPNTEAMLVAALPTTTTVQLTSAGWAVNTTGTGYKQSVNVVGVNTTNTVMVMPEVESARTYSTKGVRCMAQNANSLEFMADSLPNSNINVKVLHMGR